MVSFKTYEFGIIITKCDYMNVTAVLFYIFSVLYYCISLMLSIKKCLYEFKSKICMIHNTRLAFCVFIYSLISLLRFILHNFNMLCTYIYSL